MKSRIFDFYFRRPIFWDYFLGLVLSLFPFFYFKLKLLELIPLEDTKGVLSDISNLGFTSAGFILTFLTLIITFKSSSTKKIEEFDRKDSRFEIFFASNLYYQTANYLKDCVKSLIFISIIGFLFKLFSLDKIILLCFVILAITILVLTLLRCLLILSKILQFQKNFESKSIQ